VNPSYPDVSFRNLLSNIIHKFETTPN